MEIWFSKVLVMSGDIKSFFVQIARLSLLHILFYLFLIERNYDLQEMSGSNPNSFLLIRLNIIYVMICSVFKMKFNYFSLII